MQYSTVSFPLTYITRSCCITIRWTGLAIPLEQQRNAEVVKRRNESIEKKIAQESDLVVKRRDCALQEERRLLRSQMALDAARQQKLDNIKEEEKEKAEKDVYDALVKIQQCHEETRLSSSSVLSAVQNNTVDKIGESSRAAEVLAEAPIISGSNGVDEATIANEHQLKVSNSSCMASSVHYTILLF